MSFVCYIKDLILNISHLSCKEYCSCTLFLYKEYERAVNDKCYLSERIDIGFVFLARLYIFEIKLEDILHSL